MEFQKNEITTVKIEDIGAEGEGIGKVEGFTLFVKDAVVGDLVEARILKVKKNYGYARVEKVVTPSPFRVEPKCAYHRQCGGCQLQALSYEKQLQFKQEKIRNNLIRLGGFDEAVVDERMEPIIGMEEPWHYRNKAQYPVGRNREGHIVTGFYAGRTHSIIANTDCALGVEENRVILEMILEYMEGNKVSAYDETTGTGLVRHVLIRKGFTSGELMVCLVINRDITDVSCELFSKGRKDKADKFDKRDKTDKTNKADKTDKNGKETSQKGEKTVCVGNEARADGYKEWDGGEQHENILPRQEELIRRLASVEGMTSVSVSFNNERSNVIMGKEVCTIWRKDTISDTIHVRDMHKPGYPYTGKELTFHISPLSFYQVNPIQTEKLYSLALEYAGLTGQETVWDLYCGIGTISLFLAGSAQKVYGVEVIPQAIQDARENAKRNNITNVKFFVGKAEEVLPAFYQQGEVGRYEVSEGGDGADTASSRDTFDSRDTVGDGDNADSGAQGESAALFRPDVIVVDPPRKGCDEACLATMLKMQPKRIVYVSCDSATLARDLKVLCEGGYELRRLRGVDQFGMTVHVETVCLLTKLNETKHHVNVTLDMDELDLTSAESKATYEEIKT